MEDVTDDIRRARDLLNQGRVTEAKKLLPSRVAEQDLPDLLHLQGVVSFHQHDFQAAVDLLVRAADLNPRDAQIQNNLGQAHRALGDAAPAAVAFQSAADLNPDFADPLNHLGALSRAAGQLDGAIDYYTQALARKADFPEAHYNLALALADHGEPREAENHYQRALDLRPDYLQAMNNLSMLLLERGAADDAMELLRAALDVNDESPEIWTSLGTVLRNQGHLDDGRKAYQRALTLRPEFADAYWNCSLIDLAQGDFAAGWSGYRYRPSVDRHRYPRPQNPLPEDLSGRRFVVVSEQGLGDELFFLRFLPDLIHRGAEMVYQPDDKLLPLCPMMSGIPIGENIDDAEILTIADLPFLLSADRYLLPIPLTPDQDAMDNMRDRLAGFGPPPYVGVTYRAGLRGEGALYKEAPLADLSDALSVTPATFINVQRNPEPGEIEKFGIADFTALNDELPDMLALMAVLDDYIGVSNTNMHLRSSLNLPAKVLVTHPAEYRWLAAGASSPWFPGFTLYRQSPDGDWSSAFEELARHF